MAGLEPPIHFIVRGGQCIKVLPRENHTSGCLDLELPDGNVDCEPQRSLRPLQVLSGELAQRYSLAGANLLVNSAICET